MTHLNYFTQQIERIILNSFILKTQDSSFLEKQVTSANLKHLVFKILLKEHGFLVAVTWQILASFFTFYLSFFSAQNSAWHLV